MDTSNKAKKKTFNPRQYHSKWFKKVKIEDGPWNISIGKEIVNIYKISSAIDFGCGTASILEGVYSAGAKDIIGLELFYEIAKHFVDNSVQEFIRQGDVTHVINLQRTFDCAISTSVGEHIEEQYDEVYIDNIVRHSDKYIFLNVASYGRSPRHINVRPNKYWIDLIEKRGFKFHKEMGDYFIKKWRKKYPEFKRAKVYPFYDLTIFTKE